MIDLAALDEDQRQAAEAPRGPVCILAGAGTGKTRTITYRIANLIDKGFVSPQRVLAVTFTARAAGEMRHRLNLMGIGGTQARTFHAAAKRQLSYFWPQIASGVEWTLLDNKFSLVGRAARSRGLDTGKDMVRDLLSEIEWAKASLVSPDQYPQEADRLGRTAPAALEKVAQVYRLYEQSKNQGDRLFLDFDDLILCTATAMENNPAIAEEFRQQYRSFVVDEYQDVTPLQHRLLSAWLGERDDLTVVGDANQTIYSFTGATPSFLLNFTRDYPDATLVRLQRDYRSTPQVTALANAVIEKARGPFNSTRLELEGMRPAGQKPKYTEYDDEPTEARDIARKVQALIDRGVPANEIAVLYRINAQSESFERALADAGIPYQVRGGEGFFARAEIRAAVTALVRASSRPEVVQRSQQDLGGVVRQVLGTVGLSTQEPEGAQARERWQSLRALAELAEELKTATPDLDLVGLLRQLRARAEAKHPPVVDGVTLASLHAAKGLEWDAVFLVGLTEGSLPIRHALKAGELAIEEERRLFYVGITRAREYLYCSWAKARQEGGRASRKRTRFLDSIVKDPQEGNSTSAVRTKKCRVCGEPLSSARAKVIGRCETCPAPEGEEAFLALRAWRAERAKQLSIPAYMIFSDATLRAIAETHPEDATQLLSVSGVGPVKSERFGEEVLAILSST